MQTQLVSAHGMLAILEVLEVYQGQVQQQEYLSPVAVGNATNALNTAAPNPNPAKPNPNPRNTNANTNTSVPRKTSGIGRGIGMVSSLGLGSLASASRASLGSLGIGSRGSGSASPSSVAAVTARSSPVPLSSAGVLGVGGGLTAGGREVVLHLLRIVNLVSSSSAPSEAPIHQTSILTVFTLQQLVTDNIGFLESFCLIGGIPVIMGGYCNIFSSLSRTNRVLLR